MEEEKGTAGWPCPKCGKSGTHLFEGKFVCEGLKENESVESYGESTANRDILGNESRRAMRAEKY